jgi:hypothetical protein
MKPLPPPPKPVPRVIRRSVFGGLVRWIDQNRAITAAIVGFIGTGTFLILYHKRQQRKKRRAKRNANGAKTELVVLAGSPFSQTTKAIAADLEKRGFLVYITVGSLEEEAAVAELNLPDVRSLNFDITSVSTNTG